MRGEEFEQLQLFPLAQRIREFFETSRPPRWSGDRRQGPPDRLVYLLDHEYTQRGLAWNRHWVVNERLDAFRCETRLEILARRPIVRQDDEQVIHVTGVELRRGGDQTAGERGAVSSGQRAPALRPFAKKRQAGAQDCRLHFVEPRVDAGLHVMVAIGLSAVP